MLTLRSGEESAFEIDGKNASVMCKHIANMLMNFFHINNPLGIYLTSCILQGENVKFQYCYIKNKYEIMHIYYKAYQNADT